MRMQIAGRRGQVAAPRLVPISALLALGVALVACGAPEPVDPCDPALALEVTVDYGGEQAVVDLGTLAGSPDGDRCLVALEAVVVAADLGVVLDTSVVDFRSDDGFQPSQVECLPLPGVDLAQGQIDRRTGALLWDSALGLRGCYSVRSVAAILVQDGTTVP